MSVLQAEAFDVSIIDRPDRTVVVITGSLDVRASRHVRDVLGATFGSRTIPVDVDLGEVDSLDAAGLAAVTSQALAARRRGAAVAVHPPLRGPARELSDRVGVLPLGTSS